MRRRPRARSVSARDDLLNLHEYEKARETRRKEVIDLKRRLLPGPGELAATMFIEIGDPTAIKPVLDTLLGIDTRDYVRMEIGPHLVVGRFETGHSDEELGKLSAVHFVRFALPAEARRAFATSEVTLVVDHPNERSRAVLSPETKASLAEDLA